MAGFGRAPLTIFIGEGEPTKLPTKETARLPVVGALIGVDDQTAFRTRARDSKSTGAVSASSVQDGETGPARLPPTDELGPEESEKLVTTRQRPEKKTN